MQFQGMPSQFDSYKGPILEEDEDEDEAAPMKAASQGYLADKKRLGKGLSMLLHTSASSTHHTAK